MGFPYVEVSGAPYERGRDYGHQARALIERSCEIYFPAFEAKGLDWPQVKRVAGDFIRSIEDFEPAFVEEIRGIADGAKVEIERIIALNARTEILYAQDEGCTTGACTPDATADGHTLIGQNWDWKPECRNSAMILHVKPDDGPEIITFVEPGLLARAGLNSAGVGVVGNFLQSDADFGREGIPLPFIRRKVLNSTTLAEAVGWVVRSPRGFSANSVIGHAEGDAVDIESAPGDAFFLYPERGVLTHSNHFASPAAQAKLRDTGLAYFPDTVYRDRRLGRRLEARRPGVTPADFQDALGDHFGNPYGVCRHLPDDADGTEIATVSSMVMDLTGGMLWVAAGPACEGTYDEYRLETRSVANAA